jgi:hypothetical protein
VFGDSARVRRLPMADKKQQDVDEKDTKTEKRDETTKDLDVPEGQAKGVKGGVIQKVDYQK